MRVVVAGGVTTAALLSTSGCGFVSGPDQTQAPTAPVAQPSLAPTGEPGGVARVVGPLRLTIPPAWTSEVLPARGVHVSVDGCATAAQCPGFDIVTTGASAAADGTPYLPPGSVCSGPAQLEAVVVDTSSPRSTAAVVGGLDATRTDFAVDCVAGDGSVVRRTTQVQWYVADAPGHPVLVVDRSAVQGLDGLLASAYWASAA